jgi:prepilin-type N-terminal cleavage/methylation domain-containing protein
MLSSIKQRMDREDEGFTLIELMVVLLIIAILLAIAIPTFLGARNTANARSTQENLRNALTAEQTNWTSNQSFATSLSADEPSLSWLSAAPAAAGKSEVEAVLYSEAPSGGPPATTLNATAGGTTDDGVMLIGFGKDNNCYAIYQSDNASMDFTAYTEFGPTSSACATPTAPTAAGTTGSAGGGTKGTWYTSF